jgi:hypothetical protein
MSLDYEDWSHNGGHMHFVPVRRMIPFSMYKRTDAFKRNELAKPRADSRNPNGSEHRYWELEDKDGNLTGNHVHETRGRRLYRGECADCADVVIEVRDVSGPEFRGRGNAGLQGRWPKFCDGCRERRCEESLQRRSAAKRKADRERIADKRAMARDEADADGTLSWSEAQAADEAVDRAKWAQEDLESASRYQQRRGVRSPFDRV